MAGCEVGPQAYAIRSGQKGRGQLRVSCGICTKQSRFIAYGDELTSRQSLVLTMVCLLLGRVRMLLGVGIDMAVRMR